MKQVFSGLVLAAALGLPQTLPAARELQVGPGHPYATIQAAVAALPAMLEEPYLISIAPGVYREQVKITGVQTSAVNTLTLRGSSSAAATVIDAEQQRDYGIWLHRQKYVVLEDLTVKNARKYGNIFLEQGGSHAIRRCVLREAKEFDGVCISGSTSNLIEHCVFFLNHRAGVYLNNASADATVRFNISCGTPSARK